MNTFLRCSIFATILVNVVTSNDINLDPQSDEFINSINKEQSLWKAGRNFGKDIPMSYIENLLGYKPSKSQNEIPKIYHDTSNVVIPDSFDWRNHYPNCTTLREIRDQSACGSCWAFATTEVISDRICVHSKGTLDVSISANDLMSCCKGCGYGCEGGNPTAAFAYWKNIGIVSGGGYHSNLGCWPYELAPCEHHHINGTLPQCSKFYLKTPECKKACRDGYGIDYKDDRHFGDSYYCLDNDVKKDRDRYCDAKHIQTEIMKNGPVVSAFLVYEDFVHYKSGVYKHTKGEFMGLHSVKILGWGVENGTPYWLIANSWNTDWGDLGFFKVLRGENHCRIEGDICAGIPAQKH